MQCLLGPSSLWMSVLVFHAACNHCASPSLLQLLVCTNYFSAMTVSTAMWRDYKPGNFLHRADVLLAHTGVILTVCSCFTPMHRPIPIWVVIGSPLATVGLYLLGASCKCDSVEACFF